MTRHSFRWEPLAFGLFFLAVLGQWAVWKEDLLSPDELAYVAAGLLIALGVAGIVASLARPTKSAHPVTPESTPEELDDVEEESTDEHQEVDPQH